MTPIPLLALLLAAGEPSPASTPPAAIVKEIVIPASREAVWKAFATPDGIRASWGADARVELRPDGPYEIEFSTEPAPGFRGSEGCRVLSYVPEEMLSFTWNAPPQFPEIRWQRTFVVITLVEPVKGKTRVRLRHDGWKAGEDWDQVRDYFDRAWDTVLRRVMDAVVPHDPKKTAAAAAPESGAAADSGESPSSATSTKESTASAAPLPTKYFVYFVRPTRAGFYASNTPAEQEAMAGHVAYIKSLRASGRLLVAGPSFDPPQYPDDGVALDMTAPGITIFRAVDEADAKSVLEGDPAVRSGVFKGQVNPFKPAFRE